MKRDGYFEQKTEITKQPIEKMKLEDREREREQKETCYANRHFIFNDYYLNKNNFNCQVETSEFLYISIYIDFLHAS